MGRKFSLFSRIRSARAIRSLAVRIALFLVVAFQLFGQIDRGTIEGVVKDQSGAVVPDARVQIIQTETNSALELSTNSEYITLRISRWQFIVSSSERPALEPWCASQ